MSVELELGGARLILDDEALAELARQVAPLVNGDGNGRPQPWVRGAQAAADYLGCRRKRIYDLVEREEVEYRKDGSRLMFRPEWLDEVAKRRVR